MKPEARPRQYESIAAVAVSERPRDDIGADIGACPPGLPVLDRHVIEGYVQRSEQMDGELRELSKQH